MTVVAPCGERVGMVAGAFGALVAVPTAGAMNVRSGCGLHRNPNGFASAGCCRSGCLFWRLPMCVAVLCVRVVVARVFVRAMPGMPASGVSAAFGFKRRLRFTDDEVHVAQHVGQHMVGF